MALAIFHMALAMRRLCHCTHPVVVGAISLCHEPMCLLNSLRALSVTRCMSPFHGSCSTYHTEADVTTSHMDMSQGRWTISGVLHYLRLQKRREALVEV